MAPRDSRTLKDQAAVARDKGKHKQALKAYLDLEALEPADGEWSRRAAEMYRRLGKNADAITALERAVDKYVQAGFLVKASAACRMILQMDPGNLDVQDRLDSLEAERTGVGLPPRFEQAGGMNELPADAPVRPAPALAAAAPRPELDLVMEPSPPAPALVEPVRAAPLRLDTEPAPRAPAIQARPVRDLIEDLPTATGPTGLRPDAGGRVYTLDMDEDGDDEVELLSEDALEELDVELLSEAADDADDFDMELGASGPAQPPAGRASGAGMRFEPGLRGDTELDTRDETGPDLRFPLVTERGTAPDIGFEPTLAADEAGSGERYEIDMDDALDGMDLDFLPGARTSGGAHAGAGEPSVAAGGGAPAGRAPSAEARRVLQQMSLLAELGPAVLQRLMDQAVQVQLAPGRILFREGERGDVLYAVVEGAVTVLSEGPPQVELATMGPGEFFGEVALLTDHARTATIQAHAHKGAQLVALARSAINEVMRYAPAVHASLQQRVRERLVEKLTATSPLFAPFIGAERRDLAARFRFVEVAAGNTVMEQGVKAQGFYVLLSGALDLVHDQGGRGRVLGRMAPGDMCGETSLLENAPAEVTVRAASSAFLLELPAQAFREIIMTHPQVLMVVSDLADARRRQLDAHGAGGAPSGSMQLF